MSPCCCAIGAAAVSGLLCFVSGVSGVSMYFRRRLAGRERRLEYTLWRKEPCGEERGWIVWKGIHRIVSRWHGDATTDEETEQKWQKHLDRTEAELDRRQEMEWERLMPKAAPRA